METLNKRVASLAVLTAMIVTAGCAKETAGTTADATADSASAGAASAAGANIAPASHEADEKAIRDLVVQTVEAAGRKDMNTYLRFYAPNAALVLPGLPIQYGISAPKENGFPEGYAIKMDTAKVGIARAGDMGYAFGTYEQTAPDPKTQALTDSVGKWMAVFQKQPDGSWGAIADTYNVDPPK